MVEKIISIALYLVVFIVSAGLLYGGLRVKKNKKWLGMLLIVLAVLVPSIMAGIRYGVGVDYHTYLGMFHNAENGLPLYYRSIEPASALIIKGAAYLHSSFLMFFGFSFITSASFLFAFWRLFKRNHKQVALAFFLYLCIVFSTTLNAMRSGVAISLIMFSCSYLLQKWDKGSLFKSIVFFVLAVLFHKSALLFLLFVPVLWFMRKDFQKKKLGGSVVLWTAYSLLMVLLPVIYMLVKNIIPANSYTKYLSGLGGSFSIPLANYIMIVPIIYALFFIWKNKKECNDIQFKKILYLSLFYIPLTILVGWMSHSEGMSRISFLLDPIIICLMSYVVVLPKQVNKNWKVITIACVVLVTGLMFVRNLKWSKALPYKTIYQQEITYETKD